MLVVTTIVVAVILFSRGGGGDHVEPEPLNRLLRDSGSSRAVTLGEARTLLPFEVRLPSFLPPGVSPTPELSIMEDEGGPYLLVTEYAEASKPPAEGPSLRMVVYQAAAASFIPLERKPHVVYALGETTWLLDLPPEGGSLQAVAAWNHADVGYFAEFTWRSDEGLDGETISDEMWTDVVSFVESMVTD